MHELKFISLKVSFFLCFMPSMMEHNSAQENIANNIIYVIKDIN